MESQQVRCLISGYLKGWLTFEYPLETSKFRESLIAREVHHMAVAEAYAIKTVQTAATASLLTEGTEATNKTFKNYLETALPYVSKETKLNKQQDLAAIRDMLEKANEELRQNIKKS